MKILLVSQMYPGPDAPDLGTFVADLESALAARGHDIELAVVDRRGSRIRHVGLARDVLTTARRMRPDVVYAHFLAPAGLLATLAGRTPLVVAAYGQDVENARASATVRRATRFVVNRASTVVALSHWLRDRLVAAVPEASTKTEVVYLGIDCERFTPADRASARAALGWSDGDATFLCVGSLSERKNVLRLARAVERRGEGSIVFVGDGPLRPALQGRTGVRLVGRLPHDEVPRYLAASDVLCQPSLREPLGVAALEAMASARSVVATRVGGPPEFVTPEAGIIVDPEDDEALLAALDAAAALPRPNLAAREAATAYDIRLQAERVEAILLRAAAGPRA